MALNLTFAPGDLWFLPVSNGRNIPLKYQATTSDLSPTCQSGSCFKYHCHLGATAVV